MTAMKRFLCSSLFVVSAGLTSVHAEPLRQRIVESKPVRLGDLEFVTVTESKWTGAPKDPLESIPVELQLRITNLSDKEVVFPTFDTFAPVLSDAAGNDIRIGPGSGRDGTRVTPGIVLAPKGSFALVRSATLTFRKEDKTIYFQYRDGTGSYQTHKLVPGSYRIAFRIDGEGNTLHPDPRPGPAAGSPLPRRSSMWRRVGELGRRFEQLVRGNAGHSARDQVGEACFDLLIGDSIVSRRQGFEDERREGGPLFQGKPARLLAKGLDLDHGISIALPVPLRKREFVEAGQLLAGLFLSALPRAGWGVILPRWNSPQTRRADLTGWARCWPPSFWSAGPSWFSWARRCWRTRGVLKTGFPSQVRCCPA